MLRYKTETRPGLVALYDIRPGNGAGPFLQPRSPHGARSERRKHCALAVVTRNQQFLPAADPVPGGVGRPKFNHLEMVTIFTYRASLVKIDARNFELSW